MHNSKIVAVAPSTSRSRRPRRLVGSHLCALIGSAAIALAPAAALAGDDGLDMSKDGGLGAASAVASLIYAPIKLCYAIGGLVVGSMAWAFSGGDADVASVVFTPSVRGDYVVTREHLRGERPLEFFGRDPNYRQADAEVAAAGEDWSEGW